LRDAHKLPARSRRYHVNEKAPATRKGMAGVIGHRGDDGFGGLHRLIAAFGSVDAHKMCRTTNARLVRACQAKRAMQRAPERAQPATAKEEKDNSPLPRLR